MRTGPDYLASLISPINTIASAKPSLTLLAPRGRSIGSRVVSVRTAKRKTNMKGGVEKRKVKQGRKWQYYVS